MSLVSRAIRRCLAGGKVFQRAHVVQPIRELDEDDPRVLSHRQQKLSVVLDLMLGVRAEANPADLRHAIHDRRHVRAETALDVRQVYSGVLDDIMDQSRGDRRGIQPELRKDRGHLHGVAHEARA